MASTGPLFLRLGVPSGMEDLLEGLAREVLRHQPRDIYRFAAVHFQGLLLQREASSASAGSTSAQQGVALTPTARGTPNENEPESDKQQLVTEECNKEITSPASDSGAASGTSSPVVSPTRSPGPQAVRAKITTTEQPSPVFQQAIKSAFNAETRLSASPDESRRTPIKSDESTSSPRFNLGAATNIANILQNRPQSNQGRSDSTNSQNTSPVEFFKTNITNVSDKISKTVNEKNNELGQKVSDLSTEASERSSSLSGKIADFTTAASEKVDTQVSEASQSISQQVDAVNAEITDRSSKLSSQMSDRVEEIKEIASDTETKIVSEVERKSTDISESLTSKVDTVSAEIAEISGEITTQIEHTKTDIGDRASKLSQEVASGIEQVSTRINETGEQVSETIEQNLSEANETVADVTQDINTKFNDLNSEIEQVSFKISDEAELVAQQINSETERAISATESKIESISEQVTDKIEEVKSVSQEIAGNVESEVERAISVADNKITAVSESAETKFDEIQTEVANQTKDIETEVERSASIAVGEISKVSGQVSNITEDLKSETEKLSEKALTTVDDTIVEFTEKINDKTEELKSETEIIAKNIDTEKDRTILVAEEKMNEAASLIDDLQVKADNVQTSITSEIEQAMSTTDENINIVSEKIVDTVNEVEQDVVIRSQNISTEAERAVLAAENIGSNISSQAEDAKNLIETNLNALQSDANDVILAGIENAQAKSQEMSETINNETENVVQEIETTAEQTISATDEKIMEVSKQIGDKAEAVYTDVAENASNMAEDVKLESDTMYAEISEKIQQVADKNLVEINKSLDQTINDNIESVIDKGSDIEHQLKEIENQINSQTDNSEIKLNEVVANIDNETKKLVDDMNVLVVDKSAEITEKTGALMTDCRETTSEVKESIITENDALKPVAQNIDDNTSEKISQLLIEAANETLYVEDDTNNENQNDSIQQLVENTAERSSVRLQNIVTNTAIEAELLNELNEDVKFLSEDVENVKLIHGDDEIVRKVLPETMIESSINIDEEIRATSSKGPELGSEDIKPLSPELISADQSTCDDVSAAVLEDENEQPINVLEDVPETSDGTFSPTEMEPRSKIIASAKCKQARHVRCECIESPSPTLGDEFKPHKVTETSIDKEIEDIDPAGEFILQPAFETMSPEVPKDTVDQHNASVKENMDSIRTSSPAANETCADNIDSKVENKTEDEPNVLTGEVKSKTETERPNSSLVKQAIEEISIIETSKAMEAAVEQLFDEISEENNMTEEQIEQEIANTLIAADSEDKSLTGAEVSVGGQTGSSKDAASLEKDEEAPLINMVIGDLEHAAATRIQASYRGHQVRKTAAESKAVPEDDLESGEPPKETVWHAVPAQSLIEDEALWHAVPAMAEEEQVVATTTTENIKLLESSSSLSELLHHTTLVAATPVAYVEPEAEVNKINGISSLVVENTTLVAAAPLAFVDTRSSSGDNADVSASITDTLVDKESGEVVNEDAVVWDTLEKEMSDQAATKIQAGYRGHLARQNLQREDALQRNSSELSTQFADGLKHTGEFHDSLPMALPLNVGDVPANNGGGADAGALCSDNEDEQQELDMSAAAPQILIHDSDEDRSATKIQAGVRGYLTRQRLKKERSPQPAPEVEDAVVKIQAGFRGYKARQEVKSMREGNKEQ